MSDSLTNWRVWRFGLLVTGKGEAQFLGKLFRSLDEYTASAGLGNCVFTILAKVEQLTPRTSAKRRLTPPWTDEGAANPR